MATLTTLKDKVNDTTRKASVYATVGAMTAFGGMSEALATGTTVTGNSGGNKAGLKENPVNEMFNQAGIQKQELGNESGTLVEDVGTQISMWMQVLLMGCAFLGICLLAGSFWKLRKTEQAGGDTKSAMLGIMTGAAMIGLPFIIGIIMWVMRTTG